MSAALPAEAARGSAPLVAPGRPVWDLESVRRRFHALEAELALLPWQIGGCRVWEMARVDVFHALCARLGLLDAPQPPSDRRLRARLRQLPGVARSSLLHSPWRAAPADLLVFGHPRRRLESDGTWWDVYCDPWLEATRLRPLLLERPWYGRHCTPARTRRLAHLDLPMLLAAASRRLRLVRVPRRDRERLREVEQCFVTAFGVRLPLAALGAALVAQRDAELGVWHALLRRLRPRLVALVVSYGREVLLEACRERGVTSVELQHGVISRYHLGYAFPPELGRKQLFPDWFLSFGEFWTHDVGFPLGPERVVPVGFPWFERKLREAPRRAEPASSVVFLSQPSVGRALSRVAVELAARAPAELEILYKLHPSEVAGWRQAYAGLAGSRVRVIDDARADLYGLLAGARAQVGVYSTALVEGLAFDLETFVVELPGAEILTPLVQATPGVHRVRGADDLAELLGRCGPPPERNVEPFFRSDATRRLLAALEPLAG